MDNDTVQKELSARRDRRSVVSRLKTSDGVFSLFRRNPAYTGIRALVEGAYRHEHDHRRHTFIEEKSGEIGPLFADLRDEDRAKLIRQLLPGLASEVEATWQLLALRPYQTHLARRPFRSPRSAETQAHIRGRWLLNTTLLLGEYDVDIRWVAAWAPHLTSWWGGVDLGWLLAGAIDAGGATGDEVFDILKASAAGEHPIGQMGRHVTQALLSCSRPDAWEYVEKLLLAAQRQEGLRQAVLESVDEAHPQAFRRMLRLVRDENLSRFSATVRAFDTWFGFLWDGASAIKVDAVLDRVLLFLDDPAARNAALAESDPETVYLALWSTAFDDVDTAVALAIPLLSADAAEKRFVATHFLTQTIWTTAIPPLVDVLADPDLRVAARALDVFGGDVTSNVDGARLFDRLEGLIARLPKRSQQLPGLVWPWMARKLERPQVAAALANNATAVGAERLLPYIRDLEPYGRESTLRKLTGLKSRWDQSPRAAPSRYAADVRAVVLDFLGDSSADVRHAAFEALRGRLVEADESARLIDLLGRKPGDLRNACLARLRELPDPGLLSAADRLLADATELRRLAGLELLRDAVEASRSSQAARERIERYAATRGDLAATERLHVDAILGPRTQIATRDDALGLIDPTALRAWPAPGRKRVATSTAAARASLESLAAVVLAHQHVEVESASGDKQLLVEAGRLTGVPSSAARAEERLEQLPLANVWREWLRTRQPALRDNDELELLRALITARDSEPWSGNNVRQLVGGAPWSPAEAFLRALLEWCVYWEPPPGGADFLLDGLEGSLVAMTDADLAKMAEMSAGGSARVWYNAPFGEQQSEMDRRIQAAELWDRRADWWRGALETRWSDEHRSRHYRLLRWFQIRSRAFGALQLSLDQVLDAARAGVVDETEFIDLLIGSSSRQHRWGLLQEVSSRKPPKQLGELPVLLAAVDRCRRRIVAIESQRGDRETAASELALNLRWSGGLDTLKQALPALGSAGFARTTSWSAKGESRQETLSHLILRSTPRPEDVAAAFAAWAREARLSDRRLVELAVYAPQWAAHVNEVLGWPGLESAVWWVQAHTKDDRSFSLQELKEIWAAEVSERTPLSAQDLTEGAVDVQWFHDTFEQLGAERWNAIDAAAKYAASSGGHTRAQLFARAMAGLVSRSALVERIESSRHQDSVRALGLLPLAPGDDGKRDLLERYRALQEFRRGSRKFGSQRQQSEGRAVDIALANLARTAGYRDPQRLQWALEREAVADLMHGPVVRVKGDVSLELSIGADGVANLDVRRAGKVLKSVPVALKKDADVVELKERMVELRRQASRVRNALEDAMCRGDQFSGAELRELLEHPVLAPALLRLVFLGDGTAGYPAEHGRVLRDHEGRLNAIGSEEALRLAHPHDLFAAGSWSAWQRECFQAERVQPFKQLFRELYPITDAERDVHGSRRYAGHQVNPRQALALFGGRGWVAHPEEGVSRTFHAEGVTARLVFQEAFHTPAEIEGLTLEEVVFTAKGDWKELWLRDIPPRVFSETMRDLDLVVSVAHQGGVDPEATASTVQMRAALLRETCELLGLSNVDVAGNHAIIRGELGSYSVHLGSAMASVLPGTSLYIVAVHSQHRGRIFLPFADDDPKTAEVLSKVLLLSRDRQIRDPNILDQLRIATARSV